MRTPSMPRSGRDVSTIALTFHPNPLQHSVVFGRSPLGLPWAQVVYGSTVRREFAGVTLGHAIRRAQRWYAGRSGDHIPGTASAFRAA